MIQHESDIERGVTPMGNLEIQNPRHPCFTGFCEEHILRAIIPVDQGFIDCKHPARLFADRLGNIGMPVGGGVMIRIDPKLLERPFTRERRSNHRITGSFPMDRPEDPANYFGDGGVYLTRKQALFPHHRGRRCALEANDVVSVVLELDSGHPHPLKSCLGDDCRVGTGCRGFIVDPCNICRPIVIDGEIRKRLFQDETVTVPRYPEYVIRDTAAEFLDTRARIRREDAAVEQILGGCFWSELHRHLLLHPMVGMLAHGGENVTMHYNPSVPRIRTVLGSAVEVLVMAPIWLEAALNGPWGRSEQPGVPLTVEECIEAGVACVNAGAAIVHVHAFDPETDEQTDDPTVYARIIEGIQAAVDAIVYPTIPLAGAPGRPLLSPEERYHHQAALGQQGLLEWAVVDPGSVNFSKYADLAAGNPGFVYLNPEEHIRTGLEIASRHGTTPSYAIYEPGFVRLGAALAEQYPGITGPVYRFMFSDEYTFGYPPESYALDSYCTLLDAAAPDAPWMIAGLGVDVTPLIPQTVERGGHVRVGLEDVPLGADSSNVELVERAKEQILAAGGALATAADIRSQLNE